MADYDDRFKKASFQLDIPSDLSELRESVGIRTFWKFMRNLLSDDSLDSLPFLPTMWPICVGGYGRMQRMPTRKISLRCGLRDGGVRRHDEACFALI